MWEMGDGGGGALVVNGGLRGEEVGRKRHRNGSAGDGAEEEEGGKLEEEELGGIGAAVERDLRCSGEVDDQALCGEYGDLRDPAGVEAKLDEEEEEHMGGGAYGHRRRWLETKRGTRNSMC
jgi:hypothetical protein